MVSSFFTGTKDEKYKLPYISSIYNLLPLLSLNIIIQCIHSFKPFFLFIIKYQQT